MTATGSVGTVTNWATDWTNYDEDNTLFHNNVTSWFSQTITSSSSSTFVGTPSPLVVDDLGDLEDLYSFAQPSIDNVGGPLFEAIASRATRGRGDAPPRATSIVVRPWLRKTSATATRPLLGNNVMESMRIIAGGLYGVHQPESLR